MYGSTSGVLPKLVFGNGANPQISHVIRNQTLLARYLGCLQKIELPSKTG
jgi:hypothetical protein